MRRGVTLIELPTHVVSVSVRATTSITPLGRAREQARRSLHMCDLRQSRIGDTMYGPTHVASPTPAAAHAVGGSCSPARPRAAHACRPAAGGSVGCSSP